MTIDNTCVLLYYIKSVIIVIHTWIYVDSWFTDVATALVHPEKRVILVNARGASFEIRIGLLPMKYV